MNQNQSHIKKIRVNANIGLIGSLIIIVATIIFRFASKQAFYQSPEVFKTLTIVGLVFSVGIMAAILFGIRRNLAKLRQLNDLTQKLQGYANFITRNSYSILICTLLLCGIIILIGNYNLLMIAMLIVVMLFFSYPNIYKIKVDLGLTDDEMKSLFGDQYIAEPVEDNTPIQDPLELIEQQKREAKETKQADTDHNENQTK